MQYLLTLRVISWVPNRAHKTHGAVSTTTTVMCTLHKCTTHIRVWNHLNFFICVHGDSSLSHLLLKNHNIHNYIHIHHQHLWFKPFNTPMVFFLLNQKLQKQFWLHPDCLQKFINQNLLHNVCAAVTYHHTWLPSLSKSEVCQHQKKVWEESWNLEGELGSWTWTFTFLRGDSSVGTMLCKRGVHGPVGLVWIRIRIRIWRSHVDRCICSM